MAWILEVKVRLIRFRHSPRRGDTRLPTRCGGPRRRHASGSSRWTRDEGVIRARLGPARFTPRADSPIHDSDDVTNFSRRNRGESDPSAGSDP